MDSRQRQGGCVWIAGLGRVTPATEMSAVRRDEDLAERYRANEIMEDGENDLGRPV
jgi:hypothetical protein